VPFLKPIGLMQHRAASARAISLSQAAKVGNAEGGMASTAGISP